VEDIEFQLAKRGWSFKYCYGDFSYWSETRLYLQGNPLGGTPTLFKLFDEGDEMTGFGDRFKDMDEVYSELTKVTAVPTEEFIRTEHSWTCELPTGSIIKEYEWLLKMSSPSETVTPPSTEVAVITA
jgi:hypothetical protein